MPLLKVTGVPIAPAGKTLASATLSVRFLETYVDGVYAYPRLHEAVLSFNHTRWEDLKNERFRLPGSVLYSLLAPPCILVERQIYTDGGSQTFQRGPLRIVETSPGEWHYGTPEPDALIVTTADAPVPAALLANQLGQPGGPAALDADGRLNASIIRGLEELLAGNGESGFTDFYYLQNGTKIFVANYASVPSNIKLKHGYKNAKILVDGATYYGDTGNDIGFGINEVSESSFGEGVHHVKVVSLADPDDFIEATFNFVLEAGKAPSPEPENDAPSYDIGRYSGPRQVDGTRTSINTTSQLEAAFNSGGRYYLRGGEYKPTAKLETKGSALDIEGYPGEDHTLSGENLPDGEDLIFLRNTDGNRLAHLKILFSKRKSIDIYESNNNVVEYCTVAFGQWDGVNVNECDANVIRYNVVREMEDADEGRGISVHSRGANSTTYIANNNEVYGNIVLDCERYGIDTEKSVNSEVYDNVVARCLGARGGFPYIESDSERNEVSKNSLNYWHHNIIIGDVPGRAVATSASGGGQTWEENIIANIDGALELGTERIFHTFRDIDDRGDLTNNSVTGNIFIGNGDVQIHRADEDVNNRDSLNSASHLNLLTTIAQEVDELEIYDLQATLLFENFGGKAVLTSQGGDDQPVNATYADTRTEADVDPSYGQISTLSELENAVQSGGDYYVRGGTYRINANLYQDGTRLNLEGYPGEVALIDGSNMYTYDNESQNSLNPSRNVNGDGAGYASNDLIHIRNADGSRLAYLTFTESPNRNVNFLRTNGFVVEHCVISYGGREGIWAAECDGGRVEFNRVFSHADYQANGENGDCIKLFSSYDGSGDCRNIIIRNNWMYGASDDVVDMWTALDCLVENNVLHTGAAQHHIDPEELEELGWIIKGGSRQYPEGTRNSGNKVKRNVCFGGGVGGVQNNGAGGITFKENIIEQHYVNNGNNSGLRSQPPSGAANCVVEDNYVFGDVEKRYRLNGRNTVKGDKNEALPSAAKTIYDDLKVLCLSGNATLAQVLSKRDELMSELY